MPKLKNYIEHFSSVSQMCDVLKNRPTNAVFASKSPLVKNSTRLRENFHGVKTYSEALDLARNGWSTELENFSTGLSHYENKPRQRATLSPVGYAPHIPNYLQGRPDNMFYTHNVNERVKHIDVVIDVSVAYYVKTHQSMQAAKKIFNAVIALENAGHSVTISCCIDSCVRINNNTQQHLTAVVKLKSDNQKIRPQNLLFPLVHPAMPRVLGFTFLETAPVGISKKFSDAYGTVSTGRETQKILGVPVVKMQNVISRDLTSDDIVEMICKN